MARPSGIPTRTCTVGVGFGMESNSDLGAVITVRSSEPELVWAATGSPGVSDPFTVTITPGAEASFELIPTDLDGWLKNGAAVDVSDGKQSHVYTVTVQWTKQSGSRTTNVGPAITYNRAIIPSAGTGPVDLDKVAQYTGASGQTVSIPADLLQKVADAQAAADAAEAAASALSGDVDSAVETVINTPGSATATALNGAYAQRARSGAKAVGQDELILNVKDHGATGDGATDDTAAIQALLDNVGLAGATLYFPPGVYVVSTLQLKNNTSLVGPTRPTFGTTSFTSTRCATIKQKASTTAPLITDYSSGVVFSCHLRNLILDGNKANQSTTNHGVLLVDSATTGTDAGWQFENLLVQNFTGDGFRFGANRRNCRVLFCESVYNGGNGISLLSTDHMIFNSSPAMNSGHGIYVTNGINHIVGCDIWSNSLSGMTIMAGASGVLVSNTVFDINGQYGLNLGGSRCQITGCSFTDNGASADNSYSNIFLDFPNTTALNNVISGCSMTHLTANAWKPKYGIETNVNVVVLGLTYNTATSPFGTAAINNTTLALVTQHSFGFSDGATINFGTSSGSRIGGSTSQKIGFYGTTPVVRPVLSYSRATAGETAAGAALRTALATLGLVTDSTTA